MSSNTAKPTKAVAEVDEAAAILVRARSFLERGWCRYALALDAASGGVDPTDDRAVRWCANGALIAAGLPGHPGDLPNHPVLRRLDAAIGGRNLVSFNNAQATVEPVLEAFDRAIAASNQ